MFTFDSSLMIGRATDPVLPLDLPFVHVATRHGQDCNAEGRRR
jgi:hypothetical protein